jgi:hypothetical protein
VFVLSVVGDVPVDSEASVVTSQSLKMLIGYVVSVSDVLCNSKKRKLIDNIFNAWPIDSVCGDFTVFEDAPRGTVCVRTL